MVEDCKRVYDSWLRDADQNGDIPGDGGFDEDAAPVYFVADSATESKDVQPVPSYAPSMYDDGSSLSQVDEQSPYSTAAI